MSGVDDEPHDGECLLFGREDLARSVESILAGGPEGADALARLLDEFRDAIEGGLRGVKAAALKLYRLSLEGRLRGEDEPAHLLGAAIERRTPGARELAARGRAR